MERANQSFGQVSEIPNFLFRRYPLSIMNRWTIPKYKKLILQIARRLEILIITDYKSTRDRMQGTLEY